MRELVAERSCDELAVVALRRRELRSQAADVGGSRGDRHCCNLKALLDSHLTAVRTPVFSEVKRTIALDFSELERSRVKKF